MCINRQLIKSTRIKMGMKRNEVAYKIGTSESIIWRIEELKDYTPNICKIKKIADILNLSIVDLIL